jgi:hypothetical protein
MTSWQQKFAYRELVLEKSLSVEQAAKRYACGRHTILARCLTVTSIFLPAERTANVLAAGNRANTLPAKLNAVEQPVSERLAAVLRASTADDNLVPQELRTLVCRRAK